MPRIARLVVPNYPHHVTQRGNYRQDVFKDEADYKQYLDFVVFYSKKFNLDILSYCLMPNHVHFIVLPKSEDSMARTFSIAHTLYSQYFNKKSQSVGHLWQGRFYSCVLDEQHLLAAARYIERNPVRKKIVKKPADYAWSSAKSHCGAQPNDIIDPNALFKYVEIQQNEWTDFIGNDDKSDEVSVIRKYTMTGRPLGNALFINKLEKMLGQRLRAMSVGRPKK